ncbi:MAG TPA: Hsp20/alpha crystallin family protein [Holophagaceae bacterium]|nr:Hsp20/alpha crystallin family protein [Holophagaceae bacterium]
MSSLTIHREYAPPPILAGRGIDLTLPQELDWDLFGGLSHFKAGALHGPMPALEIRETPAELVLMMDLPGVRKEDLELTVSETWLHVHGRRDRAPREEGEMLRRSEPAFGEFDRRFELPGVLADQVYADLEAGVLRITLPKSPEAHHHHKVEVTRTTGIPGSGF